MGPASTSMLAAALLSTWPCLGVATADSRAAQASSATVDLARVLDELRGSESLAEHGVPSFRVEVREGVVADAPEAPNADAPARELVRLEGPGVLVAVAVSPPSGRLRLRLDGKDEAPLELDLSRPLEGLLSIAGGTAVLRLPVPFAETLAADWIGAPLTEGTEPRYRVESRSYPNGDTSVTSPTRSELDEAALELRRATANPGQPTEQPERPGVPGPDVPGVPRGEVTHPFGHRIASTGKNGAAVYAGLSHDAQGLPSALTELRIVARDADPGDEAALERLLEGALLVLTFDGADTVRVPLAAFFAWPTAPFDSRYLGVQGGSEGVSMVVRFPMPFRERLFVRVEALRAEPLDVMGYATISPWEWTPNTLYFHAEFRSRDLVPRGAALWRAFELERRGQWVGAALALVAPPGTDAEHRGRSERAEDWLRGPGPALRVDGQARASWRARRLSDAFLAVPGSPRFHSRLGGITARGESDRWAAFRVLEAERAPFLARLELDLASPLRTEEDFAGDRLELVAWFYADLPEPDRTRRVEPRPGD